MPQKRARPRLGNSLYKTANEYKAKDRIVTQDLTFGKQIICGLDVVMKGYFLPSHQIFFYSIF